MVLALGVNIPKLSNPLNVGEYFGYLTGQTIGSSANKAKQTLESVTSLPGKVADTVTNAVGNIKDKVGNTLTSIGNYAMFIIIAIIVLIFLILK